MPNSLGGKRKDPELGRICKEFNENKSLESFTRLCDLNPEYDNRNKCRICHNDIFYHNVKFKGSYQEYPTIGQGTSFLSTKNIDGSVYYLTVCEKCMENEFEEYAMMNKSRVYNMPNKYSQFAFDIPLSKFEKKKNELCVRSEESFIEKYGEEEGKRKWNEYVEKEKYTKSFEYMCEKHGFDKESYDEYNKSRACTLDNMISRYGEKEGMKKWNSYIERQRYTTSREYFIEKYGKEEGFAKWESFENARQLNKPYSAISQELFGYLKENENFKNHDIRYAINGGEKQILTSNNNLYYLDYYDNDIKLCIEFNGIKFHPSPKKYKREDTFVNPYGVESNVGDLWDKEELRKKELLDEFGIRTIVVWEDDYRNSKTNCIEKLINQILSL